MSVHPINLQQLHDYQYGPKYLRYFPAQMFVESMSRRSNVVLKAKGVLFSFFNDSEGKSFLRRFFLNMSWKLQKIQKQS